MYGDLQEIRRTSVSGSQATFIYGDSRRSQSAIENESIDLVFTSPPYLNNYDYSDRTRLEMYFWDEAKNWGDITQKVRSRLIMSATTQIARSRYIEGKLLSSDFLSIVPDVASELNPKIARYKIEDLRTRGDKWRDNPQRHKVALKESILTLEKS